MRLNRFVLPFLTALSLIPPVAPAAPTPDFDLPTATGKIHLQDLRGKVVLLDFWASWCGPCRQSFPWMNRMQEQYGARGLEIIAVNVDQESELAEEFLRETPARFVIAFDREGKTPEQFGVMGMPSSYLIDRHGEIHSTHIGFHPRQADAYEATIRDLVNQP